MNRNVYATQGKCLIAALRRRAMTYGEMLTLGLGLSPWKRVMEALKFFPHLTVQKGRRKVGDDWLTTWRVVPVKGVR